MRKGQEYSGIIDKTVFPTKGYTTVVDNNGDQQRVMIKGTIPGQKVDFRVSKKRSGKWEGRLLSIVEDSPLENRVSPCPAYGKCGGCTYLKMDYDNQLNIKKNMVKELIDNVTTDYEFQGIIPSPLENGYRNKMEYSFGDEKKGGELALGMHKKNSFYDIVTTDECVITHEDYNRIVRFVLNLCRKEGLTFYHKMSREGYLRNLLIRRGVRSQEILVALVSTTQWTKEEMEKDFFEKIVEGIKNLQLQGNVTGILNIKNDGLADMVRADSIEVLYGRDYIHEQVLGLDFKISTFSFFQTNSLGAEKLYEKAREYCGDTKDKLVFDLYCGTGTISQILASVAKKVIGVEIVEEAVEAAKENAKINGLNNCEFIAGDVLKVLDEVEDKPDLIVLDPPRDGVHPKALEKIINYGVENLVYISCKPTSLARDIEILKAGGYNLKKMCVVDMYPQNYHAETVTLLTRG